MTGPVDFRVFIYEGVNKRSTANQWHESRYHIKSLTEINKSLITRQSKYEIQISQSFVIGDPRLLSAIFGSHRLNPDNIGTFKYPAECKQLVSDYRLVVDIGTYRCITTDSRYKNGIIDCVIDFV